MSTLLALWASPALARAKTDVIVLVNGDRLTGEIKSLSRGKLDYKTDSTNTIEIEWDDIASLTSSEVFEVEIEDGTRYFGTLQPATPGSVGIVGEDGTIVTELLHVVRMAPIAQSFLKRLDGSVSAGLNFTHSSEIATYSFNANFNHRTRHWKNALSVDYNETQDADENTTRAEAKFQSQRFLSERWYAFMVAWGQRNEELGIDLRLLGGAGMGRDIVQTNRSRFALSGGIALNEESVIGTESGGSSTELVGAASYSVFRYDDPELDLTMSLAVFPSITERGRLRGEFSLDLRYDFWRDFFWEFSAFDSYDDQPRDETAETNDWGGVMSLGLTF